MQVSDSQQYRLRQSSKRRASSEPYNDHNTTEHDPYGWFEDFESPMHYPHEMNRNKHFHAQQLQRSLSLPGPLSTPPFYVLESSLETQQLWYVTAGQRPKQPVRERQYFEKLWAQNFANSSVTYSDSLTDSSTNNLSENNKSTVDLTNHGDQIPRNEFDCEILYRGRGSFSNSGSKAFIDIAMTQFTIQIPRFRVVKTKSGNVHAEFLHVVSLGSKNTVVFGIWRQHSDYLELVANIEIEELKNSGTFKNTLLSWQCVLQRKRWFRCLDKDYLALKCFLLERFIHDLLFESPTPHIISEFLGLD